MTRAQWLLLAAAVTLLTAAAFVRITPTHLSVDAVQNMRLQHNLARTGVIALGDRGGLMARTAPTGPSMFREPVPTVVGAGTLLAIEAVAGKAPMEAYEDGWRARWLKRQNLFWYVLMLGGTFFAARAALGGYRVPLAGTVLAGLVILALSASLDNLFTEIAAAALLAVGSGLLVAGGRSGRLATMAAAGAVMGLLILTKATFLYIFAGLLVSLALLAAWRAKGPPPRRALAGLAALALAAAVVVTPWMARNYAHFGVFEITERGGQVLLIRAYKNMMTPQEYVGSFYVWAPRRLRPTMGALLGFDEQDMQRGGPLARLNRGVDSDFHQDDLAATKAGRPDETVSLFMKSNAEYIRLVKEAAARGDRDPDRAAGEAVTREAADLIKAHPWRHLAATIPFLWRGGCFSVLFLLAVFAAALARRRDDLAVLLLPTLGWGAFMALFSHFLMRYLWPAAPILAIATVAAAAWAWTALRRRQAASPS